MKTDASPVAHIDAEIAGTVMKVVPQADGYYIKLESQSHGIESVRKSR